MDDAMRAAASGPVAVLGATGQQGGALVSALLTEGRPVRAVVRDPRRERARALGAAGVDVVAGDLGDPASLRAAFAGADGVFSVAPSSGQSGSGVSDEDEVAYGIAVADAAARSGVAHLVYSSANAAGSGSTGVGHFDTKSRVEDHVRVLPIAHTILRPAAFMEILLLPGTPLARGKTSFFMRPEQTMQFIAVRDIGHVAATAFASPERFAGRTLEIAGDTVSGNDLAQSLSQATQCPIGYHRFPDELLAQNPLLRGLAALVDDGRLAGHADLSVLRAEFPFLLTFNDWLLGPGAELLTQALGTSGGPRALR